MKLFLTSLASVTLDLVTPLLTNDPKNLKVAFIPTAADPYAEDNMPWMDADRSKLASMGFAVVDYDLKNKDAQTLRNDLSQFQIIFMEGGNTFYLLNEIRKSGFDIVIKELLANGVIYIGASAGSSVMGPDLNHLVQIDHPDQVPELVSYRGLGIVAQRILPHYGRDKYISRHTQIIAEWGDKILPLTDDQVLVVNGDNIEVITK